MKTLMLFFFRTIHRTNIRNCWLLTNVLKFCRNRLTGSVFSQKSVICTFLCSPCQTFHAFEHNVELRHTFMLLCISPSVLQKTKDALFQPLETKAACFTLKQVFSFFSLARYSLTIPN